MASEDRSKPPPEYAIMRLRTGGWAPHFKSLDHDGACVHADVADQADAVRICWEHRDRLRAEGRKAEREAIADAFRVAAPTCAMDTGDAEPVEVWTREDIIAAIERGDYPRSDDVE